MKKNKLLSKISRIFGKISFISQWKLFSLDGNPNDLNETEKNAKKNLLFVFNKLMSASNPLRNGHRGRMKLKVILTGRLSH